MRGDSLYALFILCGKFFFSSFLKSQLSFATWKDMKNLNFIQQRVFKWFDRRMHCFLMSGCGFITLLAGTHTHTCLATFSPCQSCSLSLLLHIKKVITGLGAIGSSSLTGGSGRLSSAFSIRFLGNLLLIWLIALPFSPSALWIKELT